MAAIPIQDCIAASVANPATTSVSRPRGLALPSAHDTAAMAASSSEKLTLIRPKT